jgi:hypothetical protein
MMMKSMLPNPQNLIMTINGRVYSGTNGAVYDNIPDQDATILEANGWTEVTPNAIAGYGSWTPTLTFNGSSAGITYTVQQGTYVKEGKLVHADFRITLSAVGVGSGAAAIGGLPFPADPAGVGGAVNVAFYNNMLTVAGMLHGIVPAGSNSLNLYDRAANNSSVLNAASFSNTTDLTMSIAYTTA